MSPEDFVNAINEYQPDILAMSALLTTTMPNLMVVVDALEEAGVRENVKVLVGGAPVTGPYAEEVGADAYLVKSSFDQRHLIDIIENLLGQRRASSHQVVDS